MRIGTEDRKKLAIAGGFGIVALGCLGYIATSLFGGSSSPAAPAPAAPVVTTRGTVSSNAVSPRANATARPSDSVDPSLHPEAMLLTESLVYSGKGRNIFLPPNEQPVQVAANAGIPRPVRSPRIQPTSGARNVPSGPPPIDIQFFGVSISRGGDRKAFFLHGDDVFIASSGDVVNRRYKVGAITANSAEVTDLTDNNTQRLPLAMQ